MLFLRNDFASSPLMFTFDWTFTKKEETISILYKSYSYLVLRRYNFSQLTEVLIILKASKQITSTVNVNHIIFNEFSSFFHYLNNISGVCCLDCLTVITDYCSLMGSKLFLIVSITRPLYQTLGKPGGLICTYKVCTGNFVNRSALT